MNRRTFLKWMGLGSAAVAAVAALPTGLDGAEFDPERLLWTPGAKTFFFPEKPAATLATGLTDAIPIAALEDAPVILRPDEALYRVELAPPWARRRWRIDNNRGYTHVLDTNAQLISTHLNGVQVYPVPGDRRATTRKT